MGIVIFTNAGIWKREGAQGCHISVLEREVIGVNPEILGPSANCRHGGYFWGSLLLGMRRPGMSTSRVLGILFTRKSLTRIQWHISTALDKYYTSLSYGAPRPSLHKGLTRPSPPEEPHHAFISAGAAPLCRERISLSIGKWKGLLLFYIALQKLKNDVGRSRAHYLGRIIPGFITPWNGFPANSMALF